LANMKNMVFASIVVLVMIVFAASSEVANGFQAYDYYLATATPGDAPANTTTVTEINRTTTTVTITTTVTRVLIQTTTQTSFATIVEGVPTNTVAFLVTVVGVVGIVVGYFIGYRAERIRYGEEKMAGAKARRGRT